MDQTKKIQVRVLLWCSRLRIWHYHCSSWGRCSSLGWSLAWILTNAKKKKERKFKPYRKIKCSSGIKVWKASRIPIDTKDRNQKVLRNYCKTHVIILFLKINTCLLYENIQNFSLNLHGNTDSTECRTEHSNFARSGSYE